MFEKPQHPNSSFLSPTHTPTLGLAGSRKKADPMVYGAFENTLSISPPDARTGTVSLTNDHLASI